MKNKFDITKLLDHFDNIRYSEDDILGTYTVTGVKGDLGQIIYFKNQPNEIRIFVDNFPAQKQEYSTNFPFLNLNEFADTMARFGLELISEDTRTTTNSPIGSVHWFNTLMGRHLHMGEALSNPEYRDKFEKETVISWAKDLKETSQELLRGFKYINKNG